MKYIYKEENQELIDKLKTYKLNKIDEKLIISNFLKTNNITTLKCLLDKKEDDKEQEKFKKKYVKTIIAIVILTITIVFIGIFSYTFINNGLVDGLDTSEKIVFALLALLFHIALLTIFILVFNIDIILKKNILNKLRNNIQ
jgi:uncharacterized membrane protein (DUF485 family)